MIGDIISNYLVSQGIEVDKNIYIDFSKYKDNSIAIFHTGGLEPDITNKIEYPTIQITTRYKDNAQVKAKQIQRLLNSLENIELEGVRILWCHSLQEPTFMGLENDNRIFICNFLFHIAV